MKESSNPSMRVVIYEGAGSQPLSADDRYDAVRAMLESGYAATCSSSDGQVGQADSRDLVVLGRFDSQTPFASEHLETDGDQDIKVVVRDIGTQAGSALVETVDEVRDQWEPDGASHWKPWFPVIDFDRCTNCMQCLSFCLFDVYGTSTDGEIQVQNQDNCKTDCPACSRVCPEVAILFPKYRNGPINGDEVQEQDVEREKMKVDISSLLGGDIYNALRERSAKAKSRFAKERDEEKALKERQRCLRKLSEDLDIPDDVLMELPSMGEIQQKAEQAKQRAQDAIDQNNSKPA